MRSNWQAAQTIGARQAADRNSGRRCERVECLHTASVHHRDAAAGCDIFGCPCTALKVTRS